MADKNRSKNNIEKNKKEKCSMLIPFSNLLAMEIVHFPNTLKPMVRMPKQNP